MGFAWRSAFCRAFTQSNHRPQQLLQMVQACSHALFQAFDDLLFVTRQLSHAVKIKTRWLFTRCSQNAAAPVPVPCCPSTFEWHVLIGKYAAAVQRPPVYPAAWESHVDVAFVLPLLLRMCSACGALHDKDAIEAISSINSCCAG